MAEETKTTEIEADASDRGRGRPVFDCCCCASAGFTAVKPKNAHKAKDPKGDGKTPLKSGARVQADDYVAGDDGYIVKREGGKTGHAKMPRSFTQVKNLKFNARGDTGTCCICCPCSDRGRGRPVFT